jgi:bla regulator protein BlaR1
MTTHLWQLSESFADALTYTLLHSLWQGLIIFMILRTVLMIIPQKKSGHRYLAAAFSLSMLFVAAISTFLFVYDSASIKSVDPFPLTTFGEGARSASAEGPLATSFLSIIGLYKEYIIMIWAAGCLLCLLRLTAGYWYLQNLRNSSVILTNVWAERMDEICRKLKVNTTVILAESTKVYTPVVIGFVRPFIILPAGLSSGLPAEQLESILIHELVHIRRNDFILNLFQSVLEAVFFFNPFVWLISSTLRTEREYCCDDAVVLSGANANAYVHALAALEESRLTNALALSLTGNKNQLLERIKRIMEKSVKSYSLKEKVVPVLFLCIGLVCASWFSIQRDVEPKQNLADDKIVAADTSIRKKQKSASYSRKKTTVVTPDSPPREEVVETFEGDENLLPMMDAQAFIPPIPPFPEFQFSDMAAFQDLMFFNDTIPPAPLNRDWRQFEEEFTRKFQEKFGDFYQKNQGEFQKMMKEFEEKFQNDQEFLSELETAARNHHEGLEHHAMAFAEHEKSFREHEKHMEKFEEEMRDWEKENQERMKELEQNMKGFEEKMKKFEKAVKEELVRDGYINSGDEIQNLNWKDNGDIEINGKKIKDSDLKKYRELHEKYLGKPHGSFQYSE